MVDDNSEASILIDNEHEDIINQNGAYQYISLIPVTAKVTGITTTGLVYPLLDSELIRGATRGVSNAIACEKTQTPVLASVSIKSGVLLIIKSFDSEF